MADAVLSVAQDAAERFAKAPLWIKAAVAAGGLMALRELVSQLSEKSFEGQVVFITGAGSGIGRLLALRFADLGARLALADLNEVAVTAVAAEAQALGAEARAYALDVTRKEHVAEVMRAAAHDLGDVDVLINNAGVVSGRRLLEVSDASIERTFAVNVIAHFWTVRAVLPAMIRRNSGHIVTIASASGHVGVAGLCDYSASKWAARGFDEALRGELRRMGASGVHTTCVNPFYIATGMFEGARARFPFSVLMPVLDPTYVTQRIVQAIARNDVELNMPLMINFSSALRALLPPSAFDALMDIMGLTNSMDEFHGRSIERDPPSGAAASGAGGAH